MDNQYNRTKTNAKQTEDRKQTEANQQITNNSQNCREKLQTTHNSTLQAMFKKSSPRITLTELKALRVNPYILNIARQRSAPGSKTLF